jgi:peroxiredoxin
VQLDGANYSFRRSALVSLTDDLTKLKKKLDAQAPPELAELATRAMGDLIRAATPGRWLEVGDRAPDFALTNSQGKMVALGELRQAGPVVISFYRGTWCPFCRAELLALQQNLYEIHKLRSALVAISPQKNERSRGPEGDLSITFELLHDAENRVAREFGLIYESPATYRKLLGETQVDLVRENGDELYQLPIPATYVVDSGGFIHYAFADPDFTRRADPIDIIHVLRGLAAAREGGAAP